MPVKRANPVGSPSQKRTRFASPSPNAESSNTLDTGVNAALLEEDLPESSSRQKNREKRKVKGQEEYESDSSNDEEGVVPSRRPGTKEDEDMDVDMFAEDMDEDKGVNGSKGDKGKSKEFMDLDDVEGQEFEGKRDKGKGKGKNSVGEAGSSEEGSEDEDDEVENRRKRKEQDLGIEVTPFNMKGEMEEGRFTADGEMYMENDKDPGEKHDVWLEDLDKDEIKKARRAHKERERIEAERIEKEADGRGQAEEEETLMRKAVEFMERGETVLEALQRLGKEEERKRKEDTSGKKMSWAEKQKQRKAQEQWVFPIFTLSQGGA